MKAAVPVAGSNEFMHRLVVTVERLNTGEHCGKLERGLSLYSPLLSLAMAMTHHRHPPAFQKFIEDYLMAEPVLPHLTLRYEKIHECNVSLLTPPLNFSSMSVKHNLLRSTEKHWAGMT